MNRDLNSFVRSRLSIKVKQFFRLSLTLNLVSILFVSLPALFSRPWADETFILYLPEQIAGNNPLKLFTRVLSEVPGYLDLGVFRPVSRLIFYLENWAVLKISIFIGIDPHITRSFVKLIFLALLVSSILLIVRQYKSQIFSKLQGNGKQIVWFTATFPIFLSALLLLRYPGQHPLLLFPSLYMGSAAFAMLVVAWFGRKSLVEQVSKRQHHAFNYMTSLLFGIVIASMVELAYLAIPLSLFHMFLMLLQRKQFNLRQTIRELIGSSAFKFWIAMVMGFLIVFIPTRILIVDYCNRKVCYDAATIQISDDLSETWLHRAIAPASLYIENIDRIMSSNSSYSGPTEVWLFIFLLFIGYMLLRALSLSRIRSENNKQNRDFTKTVVLFFFSVTMLAALIAGLSSSMQSNAIQNGPWRDTAFTWMSLSVILATITSYLMAKARPGINLGRVVGIFILVVLAAPTLLTNFNILQKVNATDDSRVHKQIGQHIVNFDVSDDGNEDRCRLLEDLHEVIPDSNHRSVATEINTYLDSTTINNYNQPFCQRK